MLSKLLKNTKFKSIISKYLKKPEVLDIILFGSVVTGKEKPRDLDVLILFKEKEDLETSYELMKELSILGIIKDIQVTTKTYSNLYSPNFKARAEILAKGHSLLYKMNLAKRAGYQNYIMFRYELKGLTQSKRMMFYYALNGRNKSKGIINKLNLIKLTNSVFLSPIESSYELSEFLESWALKFQSFPILVAEVIAKQKI